MQRENNHLCLKRMKGRKASPKDEISPSMYKGKKTSEPEQHIERIQFNMAVGLGI